MFMVLLVLDNLDYTHDILDAWERAGAFGITIMESTGLGRMRRHGTRDDLPMMPTIRALFAHREEHHRTLFTVVDDEALVDRLIEATEAVTGDLRQPNTGILFVMPVLRAVGLSTHPNDD